VPRAAWLAIGAAVGALGIGLAPPATVTLAGLALLAGACAGRVGRWAAAPGGLAPLAAGVLVIGLRIGLGAAPIAPGPVPTGDGPWIGVVQTVGAPRGGDRPATIRLEGDPSTLVAATLPWYPQVVPGDRVEVRGRVQAPPPDDYGAYLARIGAVGTLRPDGLEVLPADGTMARTLEGFRRSAGEGLDRSMPEPEAGLAAGVLIGLRDRVDRELVAAFTTAGASHVVAISGWNIAIVASTLAALAGGMSRRRRAVLTACAILVYVAFVGPTPSVVRAGAMAGVVLLARELGRPGTATAALGWACTVLLLIDPAFVDDAGFRLSVLATAGILAWGTSLTARLAGAAPSRLRRWVAEILGVSFAAQVATTPIVLLEFGRLSLVAPAVNLLVVPVVPLAMAAGAAALVVGMLAAVGLPAIVATLAGLPAWVLYAEMVTVVRIGAGLPLASLALEAPWDWLGAAASLAGIVAAARWGDRLVNLARTIARQSRGTGAGGPAPGTASAGMARAGPRTRGHGHGAGRGQAGTTRVAAIVLAGATIGLALAVAHRPDGVVRVVVLDVGQGDGILVEGGRGGRMVVDGGPDPGRLVLALDERLPPWDRRIDILVLTHPHEDHVAGLVQLLRRYRVGRVYEPGMIGPGPGYRAWTDAFAEGGPPHGRLSTGDRLSLDGIRFRVLWPDPMRVPERPADGGTGINNVSIVLLGEVGGQRFLLAGDVEEGVDPELVTRGIASLDLLKVAHHGSATASTRAFLEATRPRVAVVSAGAGNPYGHPATATLGRLRELAGRTYRTDADGAVEVALDGSTVRVRTSGPRPGPGGATPRPDPTSIAAAGSISMATPVPPAPVRFLCGVGQAPTRGVLAVTRPPTAPLTPGLPKIRFGAGAAGSPARAGHRAGDRPRLPSGRWTAPAPRRPRRPAGRLPSPTSGATTRTAWTRPWTRSGRIRTGSRTAPRSAGGPRRIAATPPASWVRSASGSRPARCSAAAASRSSAAPGR
jgi:competence protein ComEC